MSEHKRYYVDIPTHADWDRSGLTIDRGACPYSEAYPIICVENDVKINGRGHLQRAKMLKRGERLYSLDEYLAVYRSHNIAVKRIQVRSGVATGRFDGKKINEIKQETVMVYLVTAVKKATVRQQEDGLGDTLVGELKAVCATSESGAVAQYTKDNLKDVDVANVDVVVKNF